MDYFEITEPFEFSLKLLETENYVKSFKVNVIYKIVSGANSIKSNSEFWISNHEYQQFIIEIENFLRGSGNQAILNDMSERNAFGFLQEGDLLYFVMEKSENNSIGESTILKIKRKVDREVLEKIRFKFYDFSELVK